MKTNESSSAYLVTLYTGLFTETFPSDVEATKKAEAEAAKNVEYEHRKKAFVDT